MKWTLTLILLLGGPLAQTTLGWTYHYSTNTMNWSMARQWCRTHYTDMVVIQNQDENDYLVNLLPNRNRSPYYWIGITKNHKNESWTWIGNNSTWIGEHSWAENEPNNNDDSEFCVEIYVNRGDNRGKWNDELCKNRKFAVCYQAQCNSTVCNRGRCQETIKNFTCLCDPGFEGHRCQTAVECPPLSQPNAYHDCTEGNQTFNSTCQIKCNPGFLMMGSPDVTCEINGTWSSPRPVCATVNCPPLHPYTYHDCMEGNQTFNSTCQLKCNPGFLMIGSAHVTCEINGAWSGPRPVCTSYKHALLVIAGCGAFTACCICFCWMKRRRGKKVAQERLPEEVTSPFSEPQG